MRKSPPHFHGLAGDRTRKTTPPPGGAAFTLIELLVVVVIIIIMAVMTLPAFSHMLTSSSLTSAGTSISDQLLLARQKAMALNSHVELRFIAGSEDGDTYQALQLWQLDPRGGAPQPLERIRTLPNAIVIHPSLSPLLEKSVSASTNFPSLGQREYIGLRFQPSGRLQAQTSLADACITALPEQEDPSDPRNYCTLQINPLTGRVSTYRP